MTAVVLLLVASLVAFVAQVLTSAEGRSAAGLVVAFAAVGALWVGAPRGDVESVVLEARADGAPGVVSTTVVVQRPGAKNRQVRRIPLQRRVELGAYALWGMAVLGVLGLALADRGRWAAWLPVAGSAAALGLVYSAGGGGAGEAGVRAYLQGLSPEHLQSFTVPPPWRYETAALAPLLVAVGLAVLAVVPAKAEGAARALPVAAAVAAAAPALRMQQLGGLPVGALEGALWVGALLVAGAALHRSPAWRLGLSGAAAVLCACALG